MATTKGIRLLSEAPAPTMVVKPRRKQHEMRTIREGLANLIRKYRPLTARQLFYLAVVCALIRKTQNDYKKVVCPMAIQLRQDGVIDWRDIVDETRWVIRVKTGISLADWVDEAIVSFRQDLWNG